MFESARESIYKAIASIRLIDPHTHINPHAAASTTLADILGYHYYTELVHSSGMPKSEIEEEGIEPRELVRRLVRGLPNIENTANYQWLISICQTFFDFEEDRITESNWESLYDAAEEKMNYAQWPQMVLDKSNVESVFLTNDFDDPLEGFDTNTYIPCLRTDDLVFHLGKHQTRERLAACTGIELDGSLETLRASLRQRFEHFVPAGARACAISIPPDFEPVRVADGRAATALDEVLRKGAQADVSHHVALSRRVFWTLAELCDEFGLPFDLMIGVNRGVYPEGVYQGQDLYDSRVSLVQYRELFNAFPDVKFPVSVLASVTNQELVSYAWIFPNVVTNGHWWYSNTPSFIARDAAARLEAVPKNKQIGYYSDAYKLEFVWAKFDMYRQILADILAQHFVGSCGWSEERAVELGYQVLRGNVDTIFPNRADPTGQNIPSFDARAALALATPDEHLDHVEVIHSAEEEPAEATSEEVTAEEFKELVADKELVAEEDPIEVTEVEDEVDEVEELPDESPSLGMPGVIAGAGAALAAGAIGMVEVGEASETEYSETEYSETEYGEQDDVEDLEGTVEFDDEQVSGILSEPLDDVVETEPEEAEDEIEVEEEDEEAEYEEVAEQEDETEYEEEEAADEEAAELEVEEYEEDEAELEEAEEDEAEDDEAEDDEAEYEEDDVEYEDVEEEDEIEAESEYEEEEVAEEEEDVEEYEEDADEEEDVEEYEEEEVEASSESDDEEYEEVEEDEIEELAYEDEEGEDLDEEDAEEYEEDAEEEDAEQEYEDVEEVALDPLPSDEEIQDVDVDDVELGGGFGAGIMGSAAALGLGAIAGQGALADESLDPEPLDVGNLLDDEIQSVADDIKSSGENEIRMLRGEDGFVPDEDSLQLNRHPVTGELTFDDPSVRSSASEADDQADGSVDPIDELESMIGDTIDLDDMGKIIEDNTDDLGLDEIDPE